METEPFGSASDEEIRHEYLRGLPGYPRAPRPAPAEDGEMVPGETYSFSIDYQLTNEAEREDIKQARHSWLEQRRERGEIV